MLTVNELFSGIGTQSFALKYLGIPFKVVGISEIDKFAIQAYTALHGETRNYGNICEIDKLDYADLWTYSFPCTDISSAGKGKGLKEIDENIEVNTENTYVKSLYTFNNSNLIYFNDEVPARVATIINTMIKHPDTIVDFVKNFD